MHDGTAEPRKVTPPKAVVSPLNDEISIPGAPHGTKLGSLILRSLTRAVGVRLLTRAARNALGREGDQPASAGALGTATEATR